MSSAFIQHIQQEVRRSPRFAIMVALLLYALSKVIFFPLLGLLISIGFQLDAEGLQAILAGTSQGGSRHLAVFWVLQGGNQLLSWGLVAWLMMQLIGDPARALAWRKPPLSLHYGAAVLLILLALPISQGLTLQPDQLAFPDWLADWEVQMHAQEAASQRTLLQILDQVSPVALLVNLLVFAFLPALCEEAFFRGFLQRQLAKRWGAVPALLVTALIFSLIHFQAYGFFSRAMLGALLGLLLWRSGSLFPSILAHFLYNAGSVFATYYLARSGSLGPDTFASGYGFSLWGIMVATFCLLLILWAYLRTLPASDQDQVLPL